MIWLVFFEGEVWTWTDVSRDTVFYYNDSPLFVLSFELLVAVFAAAVAAVMVVGLALCCRLSCVGGIWSSFAHGTTAVASFLSS